MKKLFLLLCSVALAGCVSNESAPVRTYDLGLDAPKAVLPALRAVTVRSAMPFDGVDMYYRLAFRDGTEIAPFANSRWAASPADLLRRQLLRALPAAGAAPCALELELHDFTQVFSAAQASEARLELRAALATGNARIASRNIQVSEAGGGANAASGAAAFSRAANRAISELSGWISAQAACRA